MLNVSNERYAYDTDGMINRADMDQIICLAAVWFGPTVYSDIFIWIFRTNTVCSLHNLILKLVCQPYTVL